MSVLPSYRNQSIDLHNKLIDWFLYEGNTGNYYVNHNHNQRIFCTNSYQIQVNKL